MSLTGSSQGGALVQEKASPPWSGGSDELSVVTWNLGYAGLGAGSDFFADGGKAYLPPSRKAVADSRDAIAAWLGASQADVILTQETAYASAVNLWTPLKSAVDKALEGYGRVFRPDFQTRLLPPPIRIRNGAASYIREGLTSQEVWDLPDDGDPYSGALRRHYGGVASYIDGPGGCWVFVNVHLSAFDEGALLRRRQLQALLARAQEEVARGRRVVLGGDFNLRLVPTDFPHMTDERHLFWVHDFPAEVLPSGWRVAADPSVASVRTNHQPYVEGENYTTVIDGFILAPNVELVSVATAPLGFVHSDHQPVTLRVRPGGGPALNCGT